MSRDLKRVPLDFSWPLNEVWEGYRSPRSLSVSCEACGGIGYSPEAHRIYSLWYGYIPFNPVEHGSIPFTAEDACVIASAKRNQDNTPEFYGAGKDALAREAKRLAEVFNSAMLYHVNKDDVAALIAKGNLYRFTHTWVEGKGWMPNEPLRIPTPREVNEWSCSSLGLDGLAAACVIRSRCERAGVDHLCSVCEGEGSTWPSPEDKARDENWERTEPPDGVGYQLWETVSEGSPISPAFATLKELADYMAANRKYSDGLTEGEWLKFLEGGGWAPSSVSVGGTMMSGVEAMVALDS